MEFEQGILEEMERKLCIIADFIEDDEAKCQVYPASADFDLPTLVLQVPVDEGETPRTVLMNFVPLPEGGEYTDFIQFYLEFPFDLSGRKEADLLKDVDKLNRQLPLGHIMTLAPRPDHKYKTMIGMRYMYALSKEREIDDGNLLEALMLFLLSSDGVEMEFFSE